MQEAWPCLQTLAFALADTDNPLNDEMGEDQYTNITVEQQLKFPDTDSLFAVLSLQQVSSHHQLTICHHMHEHAFKAKLSLLGPCIMQKRCLQT